MAFDALGLWKRVHLWQVSLAIIQEDARNPILSSFNCHWAEPRDGETLEDRFKVVRRGVWSDLGHRLEEFVPEGSWLPKQWYAWRFCCYPGKNFRAFDGKLPTWRP